MYEIPLIKTEDIKDVIVNKSELGYCKEVITDNRSISLYYNSKGQYVSSVTVSINENVNLPKIMVKERPLLFDESLINWYQNKINVLQEENIMLRNKQS